MKKLFGILILSLLLTTGASAVRAQDADAQPSGFYGTQQVTNADNDDADLGAAMSSNAASYQGPSRVTPPNGTNEKQNDAYNVVMQKILELFAWLVGVAALALQQAVYVTVVKMGSFINDLSAIGVAWKVLRDIGNIILIFGFMIAGISIILNYDIYGWKKALPKLLMVAVLMNFSLFMAEAVIDVGNLFATQFYTQINGGAAPTPVNSDFLAAVRNEGISNKIMGQLGLQQLYNGTQVRTDIFKGANPWIVGFMGILLFLITAFVMFALAFILVARFVILLYVIVTSPLGLAGWAIPSLKGLSDDWWHKLINQTLTAPVLFLLLYIALAVITDNSFLRFNEENATWLGFIGNYNLTGFASTVLSFFIAMGLLMVVIVVAKSLSTFGANAAMKFAGAATFGATAYGASAAFGWSARGLRAGVQRFAPRSAVGRGLQRAAVETLRFTENRKWDVRSMPGVGKGLTALGAAEAASPIAKSAVERSRQAFEWQKKTREEGTKRYNKEMAVPRLKKAIDVGDKDETGKIIASLSDKEIEEVHSIFTKNPAAAAALPSKRFDKLMESEALSADEKKSLKENRASGLIAQYTAKPEDLKKLSNDTVTQLSDDVLKNEAVYKNLEPKQINAIARAGKISDETARTIGEYLKTNERFLTHYRGRTPQQQQDINEFWHTDLPITARRGGEGGTEGGSGPADSGSSAGSGDRRGPSTSGWSTSPGGIHHP